MEDTSIMKTIANMTLEQKIGQMLLIGYPGGAAGLRTLERVVSRRPMGNIILFSRNAKAPGPLRDELAYVRSMIAGQAGVEPLVSIDQEGGIVTRLGAGFTPLPGAMALAAAVSGGAATTADIEAMAAVNGSELKAVGIDWNLAPVADVNVNGLNPVIGVRSFGEDPEAVAELTAAYARGLSKAGVASCAKHFPGHGDTSVDSHLDLPRVEADADRLERVELAPFRRLIAEGVSAIMSAHVLFPAVEPEPIPATLSRKALTGLLRERLGFRGLIVTDCLEMRAVGGRYDDLAARAILAGADVLCVSHTAELQEEAFDSLLAAVRSGRIPESRVDESAARVLALKAVLASQASARDPLGRPESLALATRLAEASISLVSGTLPDLGGGCLYLDHRPALESRVEDGHEATPSMAASIGAAMADRAFGAIELPVDPDARAINAAVAAAAASSRPVVMGSYSLARHPAQAALAEALAAACDEAGVPLCFVATREPYDAAALSAIGGKERAVLCAYEYTELSTRAVARVLSGSAVPAGTCPVSCRFL